MLIRIRHIKKCGETCVHPCSYLQYHLRTPCGNILLNISEGSGGEKCFKCFDKCFINDGNNTNSLEENELKNLRSESPTLNGVGTCP